MGRALSGQIYEPKGRRKSWAIRIRVNGERPQITLGTPEEGWNRRKAQEALDDVLAEIRLGQFKPPKKVETIEQPSDPTFHEFSNQWFEANRHEWSDRTIADYRWALELHLLPFFADYRLSDISIELVDKYRAAKLAEAAKRKKAIAAGKPLRDENGRTLKPLAPAQINKTLKRLSQILELAEEYGAITRNVARGKRRKAKEPKIKKTWVEPEQAMSLIDASSVYVRPVIATLLGSGLRVGEAVALDWSDVNLLTATIRVGKAKTDAGSYRELDLPRGLVRILEEWWKQSEGLREAWAKDHRGEEPVFLTKVQGGRYHGQIIRQSEANVSRRLKKAIRDANVQLEELGIEPISERVTPHSLRRTYASLRAALGDDALYVSEQMGHKDVRFTLNVYSKAVKRRAKLSGAYLAEFDRGLAWANLKNSSPEWAQKGAQHDEAEVDAIEANEDLAL